jgi:hypothetical protein
VLDTQILFPHVFLNDCKTLSRTNSLYKDCTDYFLQGKLHWIVLPGNESEFNILILDSYRKFLADIKATAFRCSRCDGGRFFRDCESLIRQKNYPSDFLTYWHEKQTAFAKWLTSDGETIQREEMTLLREALERYIELRNQAEIVIKKWDNPEYVQDSKEFSSELKSLKHQGLISAEAHDEDFDIISDCMVYSSYLLEHGILYLVTNDEACYATVKAIVKFSKDNTQSFCVKGFDCRYPSELLTVVKSLKTSPVKKAL